jgi:DNA-binding transcriptional MerR regulator/methylmalonyl-CoA mutase cobalamin-binding subunit
VKLLRINAVSELLGLPPATLRAWERRYGVPSPVRTASAYRLYGEADVAALRRMRDLVAEGVAPAQAALQALADEAASPPPVVSHDPFATMRSRIVEAVVAMQPDDLALEIARALTAGSAITVFDNVIAPVLAQVGELWHAGEITIAHEHLASQIIGTTLADLVRLVQPTDAPRRVALACFADEDHQLALYGVALRFAAWGFRSVVLGARTPPSALGRAVETLAPDAVALSTTIASDLSRARELVDAYADACSSTVWIVGGRASKRLEPWVTARGGILAAAEPGELRKQIDRAVAAKGRGKAQNGAA